MITRTANLSGAEYGVTEADGQVLFHHNDGMSANNFAFEWTGTNWDFLPPETWLRPIRASHLAAAINWLEKHYYLNFVEGQGKATYIP